MSDRQQAGGWWQASDGKWYPPESHPSVIGVQPAGDRGVEYAGFWRRFGAILIDSIILTVVQGILFRALDVGTTGQAVVGIVIAWLYWAVMESSTEQATLGKKVLSVKVTDLAGNRISFGRATGRYFAKIVSGLILLIGYFMAGFTPRKQALHDKIADTLVVRT